MPKVEGVFGTVFALDKSKRHGHSGQSRRSQRLCLRLCSDSHCRAVGVVSLRHTLCKLSRFKRCLVRLH
jgi:hypothetical protein